MQQLADRLTEKLHTLTTLQLVAVERFVESLQECETDRAAARLGGPLSEASFAAVWNNPDDEVYDAH